MRGCWITFRWASILCAPHSSIASISGSRLAAPPPINFISPPPIIFAPPPVISGPLPLISAPPPLISGPPPLISGPPPLISGPLPLISAPPPLISGLPPLISGPLPLISGLLPLISGPAPPPSFICCATSSAIMGCASSSLGGVPANWGRPKFGGGSRAQFHTAKAQRRAASCGPPPPIKEKQLATINNN